MMRARMMAVFLAVMVMVLFGLRTVGAAGSPWTAWLYENEIGRMTLIDDTGTVLNQFMLPGGMEATFSRYVAISPDARWAAYSFTNSTGSYFNVHDLTTNTVVSNYGLGLGATSSLDFAGGAVMYDAGSGVVAFGYASEAVGWEIVVMDLTVFDMFILRPGDTAALSAGLEHGFGFRLPAVRAYRSGSVFFNVVPLGTEGLLEYPTYKWNIAAGMVTTSSAYPTFGADTYLLTGEVVSSLADTRFPTVYDEVFGFPQINTVQVYEPAVGDRYPVTVLVGGHYPRFVQAGERVVLTQYDDAASVYRMQVMERSGVIAGIVNATPTANLTSVEGLYNGFIYTVGSSGRSGGTTLYYVDTRLASAPYTPQIVWNSSLGANAQIAWTSDVLPASAGPFVAWGRVTPSGVAATPIAPTLVSPPAMATPIPATVSSPAVLTVGGQAIVSTTEGDVLNIRSGPGRSFARVGTIANGTIVTILEGPVPNGGFMWWRIQLPTGVTGWVVDFADGVQTLIPR